MSAPPFKEDDRMAPYQARPGAVLRTGAADTGRVEAFSDGVLAIVITLLVLEIKVPQALPNDETALWQAIAGQLPMIGAWVVSFLFVLVFWVAHHYFFDMLRKIDRGLLWLNGLFLLAICFMPFPTALSGQYPASRPATLLLSATMFVTALAFSAMRWYATFHARLVAKEDTPRAKALFKRGLISPSLYLASIALALVYPPAAIAIQILVPILFFFPERSAPAHGDAE
jgi:TMEM175 potassium channel family protein